MLKNLILLVFVGMTLVPLIASSATVSELEERINKLEDEALVSTEGLYDINTRDEGSMKISGYTDVEYHTSSKKDSVDGFRLHHMSLFFEKNMGQKWHFFSEIEYEDAPKFEGEGESQPGTIPFDVDGNGTIDPGEVIAVSDGEVIDDAQGKIYVEAVNLTYQWRQEANIRFGRMFTPGGIWNVDHYPSFVPTQERPQHIRKMFPQVIDGAQVFGTVSLGSTFANYDLYIANGTGNTGKHDHNDDKAKGAKLSLVFPVLDHFELGASVYSDPEDTAKNDEAFNATGFHGKIRTGSLTLQFEKASGAWDADENEGYYAQLLYDWEKFTFGVRNDFYDSDADGSEASKKGKTQNSLFVNYHVNKVITLKAEHHSVGHEDSATKDYSKSVFSVVGYLGN